MKEKESMKKEKETKQIKVRKVRPNPRWTIDTALNYVIKKSTYQGLTYWSAMDYLRNYHPIIFATI